MDYTTNIGILKRGILNYAGKISDGMKRPFRKFAADMCYGAMASKSCIISEIAHALQEDTQKINTVECSPVICVRRFLSGFRTTI